MPINPQHLLDLIACLYPPDETTDIQYADLEKRALDLIEADPHLLAEHSFEDLDATPLIAAVWDPKRCCGIDTFQKLLQPPCNVNAHTIDHVRAIHYLAQTNRHEHLWKLLSSNLTVEVNAVTVEGDSALHLAARNGAEKAIALIALSAKANPNLTDVDLMTPLHVACFFGQHQGGKRDKPLTIEEAQPYLDCIEFLLMAGAHVNAQDKFGSTPAHILASMDIPLEIKHLALQDLLEYGADLSLKSNDGHDCLALAQSYEFQQFSLSLKKQMVPSLKLLAAKQVLKSNLSSNEHLAEDLVQYLHKLRLAKGPM